MREAQVAEIVHLLGYSINSLTGARVMNRLGRIVSCWLAFSTELCS